MNFFVAGNYIWIPQHSRALLAPHLRNSWHPAGRPDSLKVRAEVTGGHLFRRWDQSHPWSEDLKTPGILGAGGVVALLKHTNWLVHEGWSLHLASSALYFIHKMIYCVVTLHHLTHNLSTFTDSTATKNETTAWFKGQMSLKRSSSLNFTLYIK